MGIAFGALQFLMQEGVLRPWCGDVLTLGRQTTTVSVSDFRRLTREHCYASKSVESVVDSKEYLSDQQLFSCLGFDNLFALDASAYENPDIIFDLNNREIPNELRNRFDLIFDGGTLEHVFDIATAMRTICRMTKAGGRIVHLSPMSNCVDHGFYSFSPTLFADFYTANGWTIRRLAVARFNCNPSDDPWEVREYRSDEFGRMGGLPPGTYFLLACVQANDQSTCEIVPQQSYYKKVWTEPSSACL